MSSKTVLHFIIAHSGAETRGRGEDEGIYPLII